MGKCNFSIDLQSKKTAFPIFFTDEGILIFFNFLQPSNASSIISVNVFGKKISVNFLVESKFSISSFVTIPELSKGKKSKNIILIDSSNESSLVKKISCSIPLNNFISFKFSHSVNDSTPISLIISVPVTFSKFLQL